MVPTCALIVMVIVVEKVLAKQLTLVAEIQDVDVHGLASPRLIVGETFDVAKFSPINVTLNPPELGPLMLMALDTIGASKDKKSTRVPTTLLMVSMA